MDDIFEKLDENRMVQLLEWVNLNTDGQVFITDTHKERVEQLLSKHVIEFQLIQL
jgi:DNA replication and repair protein RecF